MKHKWSLKKPYLMRKSDERYPRHSKQLKKDGFSDSETWALDSVICQFILPRLIRFKEIKGGHPFGLTEPEWDDILGEMIFAFEWNISEYEEILQNLSKEETDKNWERHKNGLELFAKHFRDLWW